MITIRNIPPSEMGRLNIIPSRFIVKSLFQPILVKNGLGGILLEEIPVEKPYIKDYDQPGEQPGDWLKQFDVSNWGVFLAVDNGAVIGGAVVAFGSTGVFILEDRKDLSVLWDIRVLPAYRGAGIPLFKMAKSWSKEHGCSQMKIETQNINVPACKFYQRMGARLGEIRCYGYAAIPEVANEVMLCWYLDIDKSR